VFSAAVVLAMSRVAAGSDPEPTAADRALATELFREGRALLEKGKASEACRKLEESQRLDPGGGTLLNLAICHETEGRIATAWAEFTEALGMARRDGRQQRRELAEAHIAALEKVVPHLVVVVSKEADIRGLEIKRDGSEIRRPAWGSLIPVDPGEHAIEALAPGRQPFSKTVTVRSGQGTTEVEIPPLRETLSAEVATATAGSTPSHPLSAPATPNPAVAGQPNPPSGPGALPERPSPEATGGSSGSGRKWVGWMAGGLGLGAIAAGSYFGLAAMSDKHQSDDHCVGGCDERGAQLSHDAGVKADLATVGFAIGLVGLGTGAYLLFTASTADPKNAPRPARAAPEAADGWFRPRSVHVLPTAGFGRAGIAVGGDF
jgi:hypothetical protein